VAAEQLREQLGNISTFKRIAVMFVRVSFVVVVDIGHGFVPSSDT